MNCLVEKLGVAISDNTLPDYGVLEAASSLQYTYMNDGQVIVISTGVTKVSSFAVVAGQTYILTDIGHSVYENGSSWDHAIFSTSALADRVRGTSIAKLKDYPDGMNIEYTPVSNGYIFTYEEIGRNKYVTVKKKV